MYEDETLMKSSVAGGSRAIKNSASKSTTKSPTHSSTTSPTLACVKYIYGEVGLTSIGRE